jgi:hypothetical protein
MDEKRIEGLGVLSFIDVEAWDKAQWGATAFLVNADGNTRPAMGIFFRNEAAGRKVFGGLIEQLGRSDAAELLRVSIVEGDIPGEGPGYTVYIGTDFDNYAAYRKAQGKDISALPATLVGRKNRMNPAPGSPFLPTFKKHYAKHGGYALIPMFGTLANMVPAWNLSIEKKQIQLLRVEDLRENDIERAVLPGSSEPSQRPDPERN